jgi:hypothetical protein
LKYQVISIFSDKFTSVLYPEGAVYETDSEERGKELQSLGFLGDEIETTIEKTPEMPDKPKKGEKNGSSKAKSS